MLVGLGEERRHTKQEEKSDVAKTIFTLVLLVLTVIVIL